MKIAVTATGEGLDASVDPRFGRCANFVFVDADTMQAETVRNENVTAAGGAGVQSAQFVAENGAETVLTGHCGPKAFRALQAAGIRVVVGVSGTVRRAIGKFRAGELTEAQEPNTEAKSGPGY